MRHHPNVDTNIYNIINRFTFYYENNIQHNVASSFVSVVGFCCCKKGGKEIILNCMYLNKIEQTSTLFSYKYTYLLLFLRPPLQHRRQYSLVMF